MDSLEMRENFPGKYRQKKIKAVGFLGAGDDGTAPSISGELGHTHSVLRFERGSKPS